MGTNLLSLKQQVLTGNRQRMLAQGTVSTPGTTTLFIDPFRTEPDGEWDRVDTYVKFTNGLGVASVNQYATRRITGFSAMPSGNYSLTFQPPMTASVPSGATYDLYKVNPDLDLPLSINSAIRDMFGARSVYTVATALEPATGRTVTVPSAVGNTITRLVKVERPMPSMYLTNYTMAPLSEGTDYNVTDNQGSLSLTLNYLPVPSTILTLTGERPSAELSADTDITEEPAHLIVLGARKFLALQDGDSPGVERWGRELEKAKRDYFRYRQPESTNVPRFGVGGWYPWPWRW